MKGKYMWGTLLIILTFTTVFLLLGDNSNSKVTHIDIFNLSVSFVSNKEINDLANNSARVYSQVEMKIFKNGNFNANKTVRLVKAGVVYVLFLYSPNIHFKDISIKNAKLLNASILVNERGSFLLLKLEIPKDAEANVRFEYQGNVGSQICARAGIIKSLFANTRKYSEVEICPEIFLPEISHEILETRIILDLPITWRTWTGIILDLNSLKILKPTDHCNNRLVFTSKGLVIPFLILGDFDIISYKVDSVNVTIYLPQHVPRKMLSMDRDAVNDILRTFSSLYTLSPYSNLTIVFSSNMIRESGINKGDTILITTNATLSLLAHEIAHSWFGGYAEFRSIDESLATYSEMIYMIKFYETHPEALKKYAKYNLTTIPKILDFVEKRVLEYNQVSLEPLSQVYGTWVQNSTVRNAIMYDKGAFVFRSLQFVLGNKTFFEGLRELLKECHDRECNLTDIQNVFENVSGRDLGWFFSEWFYTAKVPDYYVQNLSLEQKNYVSFDIIDKNNFTMPLEVEVKTPTKEYLTKVWVNGTARLEFKLNGKPTEIVLDPNEWMVNENRIYSINGIRVNVN